MKKLLKRISVVLATVMAVAAIGTAFGCGSDVPNDNVSIELSYWNSGLGEEWIKKLISSFENAYPEYKVYYEPTSTQSFFANEIMNKDDTTVDLFITGISSDPTHTAYLEPLDDVLNFKNNGESKTIGEKFDDSVLKAMKSFDGKSYSVSYGGGLCSIAYNTDIINGVNYSVPKTTDELVDLCYALKGSNITPFITFENGGYWYMTYKTWLVQYNGSEYYYDNLLQLGTSEEAFLNESTRNLAATTAYNMLMDNQKTTGRYQVLELLSKLFDKNWVTSGSSGAKFTAQQTKFIQYAQYPDKSAAMMPDGSWLYNEMKASINKGESFNFGLMRVPVISAITETFDGDDANMSDEELSEIIGKIDAGTPYSESVYGCSQKTYERIYEARMLIASTLDEGCCMIPNYSNAKEAAKTFLKYMYSDEMIKQYCDVTHMLFPAALDSGSIDVTSWNAWEKSIYEIQKNCIMIPVNENTCKVLKQAGIYAGITPYVKFSATNDADRLNADEFWSAMHDQYINNFENKCANAGYILRGWQRPE